MNQRALNMQDRRDRIIDAAERLIMRDTLSAFTMRGLADEVGLSVKTLYNLCCDKDAIAAEVEDRAFATLEAELKALPQDANPIRQILLIMTSAAEKAIRRKTIIHPLLRGDQHRKPALAQRPLSFMALGAELAEAALIRAVADGVLDRRLDTQRLAQQLTLSWFGMATLWAKGVLEDEAFVAQVRHMGHCHLLPYAEGDLAAHLRAEIVGKPR